MKDKNITRGDFRFILKFRETYAHVFWPSLTPT